MSDDTMSDGQKQQYFLRVMTRYAGSFENFQDFLNIIQVVKDVNKEFEHYHREVKANYKEAFLKVIGNLVGPGAREPLSLDETMGNDDATLLDTLSDESETPEDHEYEVRLRGLVAEFLDSGADPKGAKVLSLRFGIGCEEHTLQQIAEQMDMTREGVRKIETRTIFEAKKFFRNRGLTISQLRG